MEKEKQYYEISDAFLALKDIDDDEIEGMLRNDRKIREGKAFSIQTGSRDVEAAREFLDEEAEADEEIEVIDVDADSVDHLKKNSEYVGQGILSCNRCKANKFIDMDLLVASDADEEIFNIDDECPHCHDSGSGYSLIGQVGKVQKEEPVEAEPAAEEEESSEALEAEIENDAKADDEATFDNDLEEEPAAEEEAPAEEETNSEDEEEFPEIDTLEEEPEDDGMETDTSEDELDDLDLPALGDEVDQDDVKEDEDGKVKESLNEEVQLNALAEEAWMMNRVISAMNNEDAYYGSWLYIWPDEESREACAYDFGDQESFDELEETFLRVYKYYHADGLYDADPEVLEYAHKIDSKLGLAKIENIEAIKTRVTESYECAVAGDVFRAITSPEKIDKIIILDVSDEEAEPRTVFKGKQEELPLNIVGSPCKSFDVADGYLSCNIDSDAKNTNRPLSKALECFNDDKTEKVLVWDQATGDEVFAGTKADACNKFGNCEFVSFETPAVVRICINNPSVVAYDSDDEDADTDLDKLIKKIIDANNLSQYKTDKPNTNEYWIKNCLEENDDVELIYESFVKPLDNKTLTRQFKRVTGYNNPLEEAYEAGLAAARKANVISRAKRNTRKAVTESVSLEQVKAEVDNATEKPEDKTQDKAKTNTAAVDTKKENIQESDWADKYFKWTKPTQAKLDKIVAAGLFDKLKDDVLKNKDSNSPLNAVTRFYNEDGWAVSKASEGGPNPEERKKISKALYSLIDTYYQQAQEKGTSTDKKESFKSFKTRKELAEAIDECKNNSKPYTIRRSQTEGFRYDLLTEEDDAAYTQSEVATVGNFPADYSRYELAVMNNIRRIAVDIADAIKRYYNVDANPSLIIVDILQDIKLISGQLSPDELPDNLVNNVTKEMFKSYNKFYDIFDMILSELTGETIQTTSQQKLAQAMKMLHSYAFSSENIDKTIGSTVFLDALKTGDVPYIAASDVPLIEEALKKNCCEADCESEVCEVCGKCPCECVNSDLDEVLEDELAETMEVDTELFDKEMNEYFNEAYEDTVLYTTTDGHISEDGTIVLEGLVQLDEQIKPVQFTLTPENKITEAVEDKKTALAEAMKQKFTVTNNMSEEKFEFKFSK